MSDRLDRRISEAVAAIAATRPPVSDVVEPGRVVVVRPRRRLVALAAGFGLVVLAAAAGYLVGSGGDDRAPAPVAAAVVIPVPEGSPLHGDLYAAGDDGIVVGTAYGWDASALAPLATTLASAGYSVLVVDLPGVGRSPGPADVDRMPDDLIAAVDHLADLVPGEVYLLGFSHSGTAALVAAADPRLAVSGVAAMLPFTAYQGLDALAAVPSARVPLHIVGISQDRIYSSASWALELYAAAPEPKTVEILPGQPADADFAAVYGPLLADSMLIFVEGLADQGQTPRASAVARVRDTATTLAAMR